MTKEEMMSALERVQQYQRMAAGTQGPEERIRDTGPHPRAMGRAMKEKMIAAWLISALGMPCIVNLERLGCVAFCIGNLIAAYAVTKRQVPEIFKHN